MEEHILFENIFESSTSVSSSDSDDNEELDIIINNNRNERRVPKIRNYLENVVTLYTDIEFKSHFRLIYTHYLFIRNIV